MSNKQGSRSNKLTFGESLFVLMLIVFMLDFFNFKLFGFGVTMGRVLLPFAVLICLFEKLHKLKLQPELPLVLGILLLSSIFLSLLASSELNLELTKKLMPSYLLAVMVYLFSYIMFVHSPALLSQFKWVIAGWTLIILSLGSYNLFCFYVLEEPPFPTILEQHQLGFTPSKRIFLPTSSPPHLSLISGSICLWWLIAYMGYRKLVFLTVSAAMFSLCILTFSRSGFLALSVAALAMLILGAQSKTLIFSRRFMLTATIVLAVGMSFPILVELFSSTLESNVIGRLIDFDVAQMQDEKHFLYRMQAFELFSEATPLEKIFGIGVGNFEKIEAGSTYSFSIYLTLLAEQGLFGFFLITFLIVALPCKLYNSFLRPHSSVQALERRVWNLLCLSLSLLLMVGNVFYEFKSFVPMWIMFAWLYAAAKQFSRSPVKSAVQQHNFSGMQAGRIG